MAIFGYAAFGQDCKSDILGNFDIDRPLVQVANVVVVLHLALYIPNAFVITRLFALHIIGQNVLELTPLVFVMTTLCLFAFPCIVMASIPKSAVSGVFAYTLGTFDYILILIHNCHLLL